MVIPFVLSDGVSAGLEFEVSALNKALVPAIPNASVEVAISAINGLAQGGVLAPQLIAFHLGHLRGIGITLCNRLRLEPAEAPITLRELAVSACPICQ